ncbi:MAG: TetR/AcrR family transcriptional regulator [Archangium sp.]
MRDKQKEETRKRLYHAALEIFARDGVAACRIEDIAQKADVSRAAFYFHFPSKDDVLLELLHNCETEILAEVDAKCPPDASLKQILEVFISTTSRVWSDPNRCKMLIDVFAVQVRRTSLLDDREAEVVRASMSRRFTACAARGELSPVIPPEMLSDFYLLNCFAVMAAWGAQPVMPLEDMFRGMTMLFMNGARPNASAFTLEK